MEAVRHPDGPAAVGLLLLAPPTRIPATSRDFGDLLLGRPIRDSSLDPDSLAGLAALPVPTRILVGSRDAVAPHAELSAHASPRATVTVIPDLNHFFSRSLSAADTALDLLLPALDSALAALLLSKARQSG